MDAVGENIRRVRRDRGISVEQLREHLRLESTQSIYRWERGETMPQADTLIALCVFLNINPLTIFTEQINPPSRSYARMKQTFDNNDRNVA